VRKYISFNYWWNTIKKGIKEKQLLQIFFINLKNFEKRLHFFAIMNYFCIVGKIICDSNQMFRDANFVILIKSLQYNNKEQLQ